MYDLRSDTPLVIACVARGSICQSIDLAMGLPSFELEKPVCFVLSWLRGIQILTI